MKLFLAFLIWILIIPKVLGQVNNSIFNTAEFHKKKIEIENNFGKKIDHGYDSANVARLVIIDRLKSREISDYEALSKKITYLVALSLLDSAEVVLNQLHQLTKGEPHYDFLKATLFEYFKEFDKADSLYRSSVVQLKSEYETANSESEKAEALLDLWYINMYLGNENKADSLSKILRQNYYPSVTVEVNWDYFNQRLGEGIFRD